MFDTLKLPDSFASISSLTGPHQLFAILLVLAVFLYGISVGKTRALLSLLGIYVAYMLTATFPYFDRIGSLIPTLDLYAIIIAAFFVFYVAVFFILNLSSLRRLSAGEVSMWKVFLVSFFQVGFLSSIVISFVPQDQLPDNLQSFYKYIGTQQALFGWAIAALAILPLMKATRKE